MFTLPNVLTLIRIAFIPVLFVVLFFPGKLASLFAAVLFMIASLTDFFDGFLARRRNSVTRLGKVLDPLADKLLISVCLIMLISVHQIPAWAVVIIVAREMAITGLRGAAAVEGLVIPAETLGKRKAAIQVMAVFFLLLHYQYFHVDSHQIGMVLLYVALLLTVWSGMVYFYRFSCVISNVRANQ